MNGERKEELTFVLVGALLSPPLQLLAVVIQTLQAHDAVMQADPGRGQREQRMSGLTEGVFPLSPALREL